MFKILKFTIFDSRILHTVAVAVSYSWDFLTETVSRLHYLITPTRSSFVLCSKAGYGVLEHNSCIAFSTLMKIWWVRVAQCFKFVLPTAMTQARFWSQPYIGWVIGRTQSDSEGFSPANPVFLPSHHRLTGNTNWLLACALMSCMDLIVAARGALTWFQSHNKAD